MNPINYIWIIIPVFIYQIIINLFSLCKKSAESSKNFLSIRLSVWNPSQIFPSKLPLANLSLLQRGRNNKLSNIARIKVGQNELIYCDYKYRTGSGKNSKTHWLSLLCIYGQFDFRNLLSNQKVCFRRLLRQLDIMI